jgi:hypothetical protein
LPCLHAGNSKGLVAGCHSFCLFFIFLYIHTFIQSQFIHPSPFAEASLHFFIACMLSGEDLPVVPSRESKPGPALQQADALPTEPRRTITEPRRTTPVTVAGLPFVVSPEAVEFCTGQQPTMPSVSRCQPTVSSISRCCRSSLLCGNSGRLTVCRVTNSRGVLYLTMSLVSRYRLSLLHGTSSGLTVCRVSRSHGALYRTPAYSVSRCRSNLLYLYAGNSSGLTVFHVSRSRGVLYPTPAYNIQ